MKWFGFVGVCILACLLLPADETVACNAASDWEECDSWTHEMPGGNDRWIEHGDCKNCLGGLGDCHPICTPPIPDDQVVAYQDLMESARRGDLDAVVAAGRSVPSVISFNERRHSIQVQGCDDAIVANLPVPRDALAIVAEVRGIADDKTKLGLADR